MGDGSAAGWRSAAEDERRRLRGAAGARPPAYNAVSPPQSPPAATMPAPRWNQAKSCLKTNALTLLTLLGVFSGIVLGLILRTSSDEPWSERDAMYVSFVGDLFLRMLKALIIPLIVSSLISAVGNLDLSLSGKIGARAVAYYMLTTVMAVILGIILVVAIHPGQGTDEGIEKGEFGRNTTTADTLMDLVRNMFPPNLVQAANFHYRTVLITPTEEDEEKYRQKVGNDSANIPVNMFKISGQYSEGANITGLVVFSIVFGIVIGMMKDQGKILLQFFSALSEAIMHLTRIVIWLSPVGVCFLIAAKILELKSFSVLLGQLGMYFITVLVGILVHGFIVLVLIYVLIVRELPFRYIANISQPLATAFGTSSSSAALPLTIAALEEKNGVDSRVARFVLPIGATINMDGTALYEAVAAIFIAQVRNVSLGIGSIIAISITATAASIGAAGIPQAGLVTMVMVLDTVGLPAEDVSLIIAVDWLLDRFRTTINVLGDSLGAGIVNHLSKQELANIEHRADTVTAKLEGGENGMEATPL
ncbi:Excitatory amino acid transporter 3 [Amphibalanus amphitrite]|nr:excitatory amino acid transporter 1-like isoform X1 [Amphibalanus amphitrite]XP_043242383.1 excitatory amino acid transporter 1-like isoform X1 [Amphibalanus amphitrite]KAF0310832.1 Excitatory amino acid transporter 3 [Amphibalanus amphitrite]